MSYVQKKEVSYSTKRQGEAKTNETIVVPTHRYRDRCNVSELNLRTVIRKNHFARVRNAK